MSIKDSNAKLEEDLTDLNSLYDDAVVALAKLEQRNTKLVAALEAIRDEQAGDSRETWEEVAARMSRIAKDALTLCESAKGGAK